jgi:hypothetical protein
VTLLNKPTLAVACIGTCAYLLMGANARAYETGTHELISEAAATDSTLRKTSTLMQLGLKPVPINSQLQTFRASTGDKPISILALIRFGARWEDDLSELQALRHFYDPVNDRALDLGPDYGGVSYSVRSPDWALEDKGEFATQLHSLADARTYLYKAVTLVDPLSVQNSANLRSQYFGLTFQTLGHVMHHLQDMAQPQHVRNDLHCDAWVCKAGASISGNPEFHAPSVYEKYTNLDGSDPLDRIRSNLPFTAEGSAPVFPPSAAMASPFKMPRHFWRTTNVGGSVSAGRGIAEYTNRNFYSAGTMHRYAQPPQQEITLPSESADIRQLLPGTNLSGDVWFYKTVITEGDSPSVENSRAASHSIFDPELRARILSTEMPGRFLGLNRFTFDAAHKFLIPRAVGYSAGIVNFFFRGQFEISPPDEGVYGIVDHTVEKEPDVDGFAKIKLKLRNITPGGRTPEGQPLVEPIPDNANGTLVAVVKFRRNNCYRSDLSGEYGSPGIDWHGCRAAFEEIVVSSPQPVPPDINSEAKTLSFTFANKIPINATDVYLQVVYRGPLGDEPDAVVVATRDIGEPLFFAHYVRWDQYRYSYFPSVDAGPFTFIEWCAQGYASEAECRSAMGMTLKLRFGESPGYTTAPAFPAGEWEPLASEPPLAAVATMTAPVGNYVRVALLADGTPRAGVLLLEWIDPTASSLFQWFNATLIGNRNQLDFETDTLVPLTTYVAGRGIYVPTAEGPLLNSGNAPSIPPLAPTPSQIAF